MKERRKVPFRLHEGSCIDSLKQYAENHFDSCVTDPPYDLTAGKRGGSGVASTNLDSPYGRSRIGTGNGGGFMGKRWDGTGVAFDPATWAEVLRVMKPGAHLLAFGGTRTWHRMVCAIEDAGFEVRDSIMWLYGSGFPKSLDASLAIDNHLGLERVVTREGVNVEKRGAEFDPAASYDRERRDEPASPQAAEWDGWGTALKPAWEPIVVARKPLHGTVASNVLAFGTGAINIDGCRVPGLVHAASGTVGGYSGSSSGQYERGTGREELIEGRWPANVIHDGSAEVMAAFPYAPGALGAVTGLEPSASTGLVYGKMNRKASTPRRSAGGAGRQSSWKGTGMLAAGAINVGIRDFGDDGSAARFFYCAKASQEDRHEGTGALEAGNAMRVNAPRASEEEKFATVGGNTHPTVKPTELMRYLCKLVTRPGGLVLDPFCGSGSTGKAAMFERMRFVGMDLDASHIAISHARIAWALRQLVVRDPFGLGD